MPLACIGWGSAAWAFQFREQFIGWPKPVKNKRLHYIANNTRYLILPWVLQFKSLLVQECFLIKFNPELERQLNERVSVKSSSCSVSSVLLPRKNPFISLCI
ncbi:Druantia anti-phage system protein DruA [Desulfotignum balticum]|uniref:Druantia anti-phage system protein DruA n=1 Tax=Desulfotignum balticum TaxID=115781 RepID=UPI001FDEEF77|nr:Druantia anti-phage system protein DruA [Desulfotignum balticum]